MIKYEEFKNWLKEQELSRNTINSYTYSLKQYEKINGDDFSKDKVMAYKWKVNERLSAKTANSHLCAIKKYCKFSGTECDVKKIKVQKETSIENVITLEEFNTLVDSLKKDGKMEIAAYFIIPAKTGARINELLRLTKRDLDNGYACLFTKGKQRTIYFPKKLQKEIQLVFKELKPDDRLVRNKHGEALTARGYDYYFKRYAKKYGIPIEKAHAHGLRHLFAKEFLKRNQNIALLADVLGHSGVNTTMIYTRDSKEEQINKINDTVDW